MSFALHDAGLTVRPYTTDDIASLHATVRGSIGTLSHWLPWCHAGYSLDDAAQWVAYCIARWERGSEFPMGVFDAAGAVIGGCGLNRVDRTHNFANLGYWIADAHCGRGHAVAAAGLVARFGFETLGFSRLEILVLPENHASVRVAEKLGATREGVARNRLLFQGRAADAVVYSLVPGDLRDG